MSSKRVRKVANKMLSSIPHLYYISILSIFFYIHSSNVLFYLLIKTISNHIPIKLLFQEFFFLFKIWSMLQ